MRIARFAQAGTEPRFGLVELAADAGEHPETIAVIDGDPLAGPVNYTGERLDLAEVRLLAPVIPRTRSLRWARITPSMRLNSSPRCPVSPWS